MNLNLNRRADIRPGIPTVYYINRSYDVGAPVGYIVLLVDCTSGSITINLPTTANNTDCFVIKKIDSSTNAVVITPSSGQTIDAPFLGGSGGSATVEISVQYTSLTLVCNNSGGFWQII